MFSYSQLLSVEEEALLRSPSSGIFMLLVGWGMLSDIDFDTEKWRWMGEARFTLMGAYKVFKNENYSCTIYYATDDNDDEVVVEDGKFVVPPSFKKLQSPHFFVAASGPYISISTKIAPEARLDDGKLWLVSASNMSLLQRADFLTSIETGAHVGKPGVSIIPVTRLVIEPGIEEKLVDIDGERHPSCAVYVKPLPWKARIAC
jgi:sphingosine kinase